MNDCRRMATLALLCMMITACSPAAAPTPTPTATLTPSATPTPSITPQPTVGYTFDNWLRVEVPAALREGAAGPLILFANSNDRTTISNAATPRPENLEQILYLVSPGQPRSRVPLLTLNSSTGNQIWPSANGAGIAFMQPDGLYILNARLGVTARIAIIRSLTQRGLTSPPVWTPDGARVAVTLDTGYALDIFIYDTEGGPRTNITSHGSYDFFPVYSPDGRFLAFVSDRLACPSWTPGDANACDALTRPSPAGGTVFVLELATGELTQVGDVYTTEPVRWISNRQFVIAGGDQLDLLNPRRELYLVDTDRFRPRRVVAPGDEDALYLADTWARDGSAVLVQRATANRTDLLLLNTNGTIIAQRSADLSFPRFGVSADWSPIEDRIAIGGVGGSCPYGVRVVDRAFDFIARGNPPPSMCDPQYSPDGRFLAFTGVNPRVDGRVDLYSASASGFDAVNLTPDLRGQIILVGWITGG